MNLVSHPIAEIAKILLFQLQQLQQLTSYNFFVGLATRLPEPKDLVKYAESCMYSPAYRNYR